MGGIFSKSFHDMLRHPSPTQKPSSLLRKMLSVVTDHSTLIRFPSPCSRSSLESSRMIACCRHPLRHASSFKLSHSWPANGIKMNFTVGLVFKRFLANMDCIYRRRPSIGHNTQRTGTWIPTLCQRLFANVRMSSATPEALYHKPLDIMRSLSRNELTFLTSVVPDFPAP